MKKRNICLLMLILGFGLTSVSCFNSKNNQCDKTDTDNKTDNDKNNDGNSNGTDNDSKGDENKKPDDSTGTNKPDDSQDKNPDNSDTKVDENKPTTSELLESYENSLSDSKPKELINKMSCYYKAYNVTLHSQTSIKFENYSTNTFTLDFTYEKINVESFEGDFITTMRETYKSENGVVYRYEGKTKKEQVDLPSEIVLTSSYSLKEYYFKNLNISETNLNALVKDEYLNNFIKSSKVLTYTNYEISIQRQMVEETNCISEIYYAYLNNNETEKVSGKLNYIY